MNRVYGRLWTVPYRSFQELRKRLKEIEAAVERSEPEARRVRREAIKGTAEEAASKQGRGSAGGNAIRSLPMRPAPAAQSARWLGRFSATDGALADRALLDGLYFRAANGEEYGWTSWRTGTLEELVTTWPAWTLPEQRELERGWWMPTLDELRVARLGSRRRAEQKDKVSGERTADHP
jgi:hypothetical protein